VLQRWLSFWKVLPSPSLELCQWPSGSWTKALLPDCSVWPALGIFLVVPNPSPDLCSELNGQFPQPHGLVFALTCTVNCGTVYILCAFLNHVLSIEFTTGWLQVVETSQGSSMETGYTWAQFRIS
jgi:hypothetical protein